MIKITNQDFLNQNLDPEFYSESTTDNPIIFYHSVLTVADISATTEPNPDRPATNLWNPDTASVWEGTQIAGAEGYLSGDDIYLYNTKNLSVNYVAICGHNFAQASASYRITLYKSTNGASWTQIDSYSLGATDSSTLVFYFDETTDGFFKIEIELASSIPLTPIISHIKMGMATVLQRRIYSGYERPQIKTRSINNGSESGQYLGQVIISKYKEPSAIKQENNTPDFVEVCVNDFLNHCNGIEYETDSAASTFVFCWRPFSYPVDVVYGWATDISYPVIQKGSVNNFGLVSWSVSIGAIL